nr:uncharacterized protein LOC107419621 [Ziziphus jujuba var. spinosa]
MEDLSMAKYLLKMKRTVDAPAFAGISLLKKIKSCISWLYADQNIMLFVICITTWTKQVYLPDLCAMLLAHECRLDQTTSAIPEMMSIDLSQRKESIPKNYSPDSIHSHTLMNAMAALTDTPIDLHWYLDSEATNHYASSPTIFSNKQEITCYEKTHMVNEEGLGYWNNYSIRQA